MSHPNELEKADIQHEEGDIDKEVLSDPYIYENLIRGAIDSSEAESKMGFVGLWKIYYPAAIWSMSLSVALVMEGMDIGLVSLDVPCEKADDRSIISSGWTLISTILDIQLPTGASTSRRIGRLESITLRKEVRSLGC
jgi:hypothetical protein